MEKNINFSIYKRFFSMRVIRMIELEVNDMQHICRRNEINILL